MELSTDQLVLIPVVAAILQVAKRLPISAKLVGWFPFIGVGVAYLLTLNPAEPQAGLVAAIVIGLSASGAYEAVKNHLPDKKK